MEKTAASNRRKNKDFNPHNCPVTHFLNRTGGKWKVLIIWLINKTTTVSAS
ncbi:hypothetical protein [Emticicia fontis]